MYFKIKNNHIYCVNITLKNLFCILEKYLHTSHLPTAWFRFNLILAQEVVNCSRFGGLFLRSLYAKQLVPTILLLNFGQLPQLYLEDN